VKGFFSETQRPEAFENRSYPAQWPHFAVGLMTARQPMSHTGDGLTEEGKSQLGRVQATRPAANSGGIGQPIGVLQLRQCLLPWTVLHKVLPQCLTARQQTVMRVREREHRKECKGHSAINAAAAMDPNPVVMFVVCLLAAPSVTNDRIPITDRASA